MSLTPTRPYRSGLAAGLGVVLSASAIPATADVVHARGGGLALVGLWAVLGLSAALAAGVVVGAGNATWGPAWIRRGLHRIRVSAELDRAIAAGVLSAAVVSAVLVIAIAALAIVLVGSVQRQAIGALLLGVAVAGLVPVLAMAALPIYRMARFVTPIVPKIGPLSRSLVLVLAMGIAGTAACAFVVVTRLDYHALDLGFVAVLLVPVIAAGLSAFAFGPFTKLRQLLPHRGWMAGAAAIAALVIALVGLGSHPDAETVQAVSERSYIGKRMIAALRKLIDRDRDGYSAFFGGPDCDDHAASVHPGATDIPGNGVDENCLGGDAPRLSDTSEPGTGPAEPATKLAGGQNLVVIFVDTLRYDRLGISGYRRDGKSLTPRIDEFAAQSVGFRRAYAQAPNTPRSVPSFLASRYPSQVAFADKDPLANYPTVSSDNDTLFEAMKAAGFTTIGQSSHFYFCDREAYPETCGDVLNTTGRPMRTNIIQGADLWDNAGAMSIPNSNRDIAGPRIVKRATSKLEELARANTKFAMIVHLFEPHSTYVEHPEFAVRGRGETRPEKYDYEIAFEDGLVGQLLDALDRSGLAKNTTVVLLSDHGEAFGVHGGEAGWYHGMTLYNEILHVPLLFRVPGVPPATRDDVVQLLDVAPTIACLFNVPPPASWQGRCLAPAIAGKSLYPLPAFAELLPTNAWKREAKSIVSSDANHHAIYNITHSRWEVFDLAADPEERRNFADSGDPKVKELQSALTAWIEGPLAAGR